MEPNYKDIVTHYEKCFAQHGATPKGVDWPNADDLLTRFQIMLNVCEKTPSETIKLLDLGCGYGALYEYLTTQNLLSHFDYTGIDLSTHMIEAAKQNHPKGNFFVHDIVKQPLAFEQFDYIIMNGVLTEKVNLTQEKMLQFAHAIIKTAFATCKRGIAFNVMNEHVDWKRDDLFYWSFDHLTQFLHQHCSRHIVLRADYGLYEYTAYVYKQKNTR